MKRNIEQIIHQFQNGELDRESALRALLEQQTVQTTSRMPEEKAALSNDPPDHDGNGTATADGDAALNLATAIEEELALLVCQQLKLSRADLDSEADLSEYGFDSITLNEFSQKLEAIWGIEIVPADLIEHSTLASLARYFADSRPEELRKVYEMTLAETPPVKPSETLPDRRPEVPEQEEEESTAPLPDPIPKSRAAGPLPYEPIAVIGMSGRFPSSPDLAAYWENLAAARDLIAEIPQERKEAWDALRAWTNAPPELMPRWAGLMPGVSEFDPLFFNISPNEAEMMDPQQRLFLQTVWETLEDAGYAASHFEGSRMALNVGVASTDYTHLLLTMTDRVDPYHTTGLSNGVLANRVSFFFDWHGPNEPVDTACSSSLVAVHRAIRAIQNGEADFAIAGGVSVLLSPLSFLGFAKAGMLAPDGRCKTFDSRANGYVRGEGVGAVLLKPLAQAEADGDHIYAVIRGSAVNHGGRASSLTAPDGASQADCLIRAHQAAEFDPATLTYIEAHGTGTSLGDPRECQGIVKALGDVARTRALRRGLEPRCGLGSVKTNIGHLEAAAGIASLIKVILAMRHQILPASLHLRELNPKIQLAGTPLYIVRETQTWPALEDADGRPIPRRAGINSFGFGGINAHVAIEEYVPSSRPAKLPVNGPKLFVLSAKNADSLKKSAGRLKDYLEQEVPDLDDLAYTLGVGREPFQHRLAIVARSREELAGQLQATLEQGHADGVLQGRGKARKGERLEVACSASSADMMAAARAWVDGASLDWTSHFSQAARRLSLPTYPFVRRVCWLGELIKEYSTTKPEPGLPPSHPLIDAPVPARPATYSKLFNGTEFFVEDHVIGGRKVLPAVVCLEMAREAGEQYARQKIGALRNVVWIRPFVFDHGSVRIEVRLSRHENDLKFEIGCSPQTAEQVWEIHARGRMSLSSSGSSPLASEELRDLEAIQRRCRPGVEKDVLYQTGRDIGFHYGPSFQVVESLAGNREEALATLRVPQFLEAEFSRYVLHPSLLDAATQAVTGVGMGDNNAGYQLSMTFSVGRVEWIGPLPRRAYAHARLASSDDAPDKKIRAYNIEVLDEGGRLVLRLQKYMARPIPRPRSEAHAASPMPLRSAEIGLVYALPYWTKLDRPGPVRNLDGPSHDTWLVLARHDASRNDLDGVQSGGRVILAKAGRNFKEIASDAFEIRPSAPEDYLRLMECIGRQGEAPSTIVHAWNLEGTAGNAAGSLELDAALEESLYSVVHLLSAWLKHRNREGRFVYAHDNRTPIYASVSGLLRSLAWEHPGFQGCVVQLEPGQTLSATLAELRALPMPGQDQAGLGKGWPDAELRRAGSTWESRRFLPHFAGPRESLPLKVRGVYLIAGGAGGLGMILARHLAERYQARLVLAGRSPASGKDSILSSLNASGGEAVYIQADITRRSEAAALVEQTRRRFGHLNGIIQCAGVLADGAFLRKDFESFQRVLAPKIFGTVHLNEAVQNEALDFFIMFSSQTGTTGNRGQTDYSSANRFLDEFAVWREEQRRNGRCSGRTVSIGWPLWKGGGMTVPTKLEEQLWRLTGIMPLEPEAGMEAWNSALGFGQPQVLVLYGDRKRIFERAGWEEPAPEISSQPKPVAVESTAAVSTSGERGESEENLARMHRIIANLLGQTLKVGPEEIDPETDFSEYGVDSISAMELLKRIEEETGSTIEPSTIMEYSNLDALAAHLAQSEAVPPTVPVAPAVGESGSASEVSKEPDRQIGTSLAGSHSVEKRVAESVALAPNGIQTEAIAVVSLAVRFSQSPTVEKYWENLCGGVSLISEVPEDRWRLENFYSADRSASQKSYSKWGSYLEHIDRFDSEFFQIKEEVARGMDPQQWLALELTQELLDRAGYRREELLKARVGVFLGAGDNLRFVEDLSDEAWAHLVTNRTPNMLARQIMNFYDFRGPAWVLDTACSSALVAVHHACQSLFSGECEMAVAGGIQLLFGPILHIAFSKAGILSDDGAVRVFDRRAGGFTLGEGAGLILLKPLRKAVEDGDPIQAVILGSAVNNDGRTLGLTTPNLQAQKAVLESAYARAGISPNTISYLEANGSGNLMGDPVEIQAATQVFQQSSPERQFCGVGSVKSNIGHLLRAAAMPGFAKVILGLVHGRIPPTLHCENPHPWFRFPESPFFPVTRLMDWPSRDGVRRAAMSAFGFAGTNCHVILEAFDRDSGNGRSRRPSLPLTSYRKKSFPMGGPVGKSMARSEPQVSDADGTVPLATAEPHAESNRPRWEPAPATASDASLVRELERRLAESVAAIGGLSSDELAGEKSFMDLGVTSVNLVEMAQELEAVLGVELPPVLFFEYQSIEALAEYLVREHGQQIATVLRPPDGPPERRAFPVQVEPPEVRKVEAFSRVGTRSASAPREGKAEPRKSGRSRPARESACRDIAIIGVGGRFPDANNPDQFWKRLIAGENLIRQIPADHFDFAPWFDPRPQAPNKLYCKWGGFLAGVDQFDAAFFRVPEREADLMDPQLRLLLEVMHETGEEANYSGRLRGTRCGVYVGACSYDYGLELARMAGGTDPYLGTGTAISMLANRPSYIWDLRGPSLVVDTACSSSLVAVHLACRALREGECDMAFAAGVNLLLSPQHYLYFCAIGALSPSGRCHTFDERADGYVPGEAVGCLLLKPLDKALQDRDQIHAVIKGSAVNHGGYTNTVTAPSPGLQSDVIVRAWEDAGIDPHTLGYIEAHGTGTRLGDPVEIQGIKRAFERFGAAERICAIGSAKAHLGHTEGAAGITGIIKTILSMQNRRIPAMPEFRKINPLIQLDHGPVYINERPVSWSSETGTLRAGVSSFGFGGAYGHLVLESWPEDAFPDSGDSDQPVLFNFSARNEERLDGLLNRWSEWLEAPEQATLNLANVAYTLQVGREAMESRIAFVAATRSELMQKLKQAQRRGVASTDVLRGTVCKSAQALGRSAEDSRYFQELFRSGQLEKLGIMWTWGARILWSQLHQGQPRRCVPLPSTPFVRKRHWYGISSDDSTAGTTFPSPGTKGPERSWIKTGRQFAAHPQEKSEAFHDVLVSMLGRLVEISPERILPDTSLEALGLDSIMGMRLIKDLQERFAVPLYTAELQMAATVGELTEYLEKQIAEAHPTPSTPSQIETGDPNAPGTSSTGSPIVFLLSAPRSGSTLVRVVLAGHADLFCPPELHLLPFGTIRERATELSAAAPFLAEGLIRAVMALRECTPDEAKALVSEWQEAGLETADVYRRLQEWAGSRMVIDKSPSYGQSLATLEQSRQWFPDARYIFLFRHPGAVMESFVRNRFDKLFRAASGDPWENAEIAWRDINRNLLAFRESLPSSSWIEIRYEDFVARPAQSVREICAFLGIAYDDALLKIDEGNRLTDGVHSLSLSIGDPNFLNHQRIEPELADAWRGRCAGMPDLSDESRRIAHMLGYDSISEARVESVLTPAQSQFFQLFPDCSIWNLEHRISLECRNGLDSNRLRAAWGELIENHPTLRTVFCNREDGVPYPILLANGGFDFQITEVDLSDRPVGVRKEWIDRWIANAHREIDPAKWPLFRFASVALGGDKYEWLWVSHHLIGDGRTSTILFEELTERYEHPDRTLLPRGDGIARYAVALRALLDRAGSSHEVFWKDQLRGDPFDIPCDHTTTTAPLCDAEREIEFAPEELGLEFPPDFATCSVALYRTMAEWSGIAAPVLVHRVHGRRPGERGEMDVAGCFAFDFPLRFPTDTSSDPAGAINAFEELYRSLPVGGATYLPLALAGKLPAAHELSPVRLNYQPVPLIRDTERFSVLSWRVKPYQPGDQRRLYLIDFVVRVMPSSWFLLVRYSSDRLSAEAVRSIVGHWSREVAWRLSP